MSKHKYHRENCNSTIRATVKVGNETISLCGTHAFEWSIVKQAKDKVQIFTFSSRELAVKDFQKYKKLGHAYKRR